MGRYDDVSVSVDESSQTFKRYMGRTLYELLFFGAAIWVDVYPDPDGSAMRCQQRWEDAQWKEAVRRKKALGESQT